jgi:hypothetical protein
VVSGETVSAGPDHYFTTAPSRREPFRFVVFGDSQGPAGSCASAPAWERVARMVDGLHPDLVLGTGDYVASGEQPACWERWLEASGALFRHTPFLPAVGNHDYERQYYTGEDNRGLQNFRRMFALPAGPEPGTATTYYAFTYGNSRFILYDDYKPRGPGSTQLRWLERELAQARGAPAIQHVFVLDHTTFEGAGYFCATGTRDPNQAANRAWVEPLLERYQVDATFAGHEHTYQRADRLGVHHVVTGGAGGLLENSTTACLLPRCSDHPGLRRFNGCTHHAVLMEVDGAHVSYAAIAEDGHTRLDGWENVHWPEKAAGGGLVLRRGPGDGARAGGGPWSGGDVAPAAGAALLAGGLTIGRRRRRPGPRPRA